MPTLTPRTRLIRDAMIYTPLFALTGGIAVLMLVGAVDFAVVAFVLLAGMGFLFGYQSIQSWRDLAKRPVEVSGPIGRRWSKRDAFVAKSYYIAVNKAIFRIPVENYLELQKGDTVLLHAYPHTGTVVSVERTGRMEPEAPAPPKAPGPIVAEGRQRTLRTARLTPSTRPRKEIDEPPPHEGVE